MEIRLLGAHNTETSTTRHVSLLVDGVLALDAGGINGALSLAEQDRLQALLITHRHFDHMKDVPTLGLNTLNTSTIDLFAPPSAIDALTSHLMNGVIWGRLWEMPSPEQPSYRLHAVEDGATFQAAGYQVQALPMPHSVPAAGYLVASGGRSFFYTGDTGPGCGQVWSSFRADLLVVETTYPNRLVDLARLVQHLTPALLRDELMYWRAAIGALPRVLVAHHNPRCEDEIAAELAEVARELDADIGLGQEGMVVSL